jgi:hypothetical protein
MAAVANMHSQGRCDDYLHAAYVSAESIQGAFARVSVSEHELTAGTESQNLENVLV